MKKGSFLRSQSRSNTGLDEGTTGSQRCLNASLSTFVFLIDNISRSVYGSKLCTVKSAVNIIQPFLLTCYTLCYTFCEN